MIRIGGFHFQLFVGIKRRQVIKENFVTRQIRRFKVDRLNLDERKITLTLFGRADLTRNGIAGSQIKFTNLRRADINIVWSG
jgi:hypothetical protein